MSSETIVILLGTLLFFGFAAWMAFYSRGNDTAKDGAASDRSKGDETTAGLSNEI